MSSSEGRPALTSVRLRRINAPEKTQAPTIVPRIPRNLRRLMGERPKLLAFITFSLLHNPSAGHAKLLVAKRLDRRLIVTRN